MRGGYSELLYSNKADFSAKASFTTEASLLEGQNLQPILLAPYFAALRDYGRALRVTARGVLSTTGTPTYQFTVRASTTQGATTLSGSVLGISQAITTASGVSNAQWNLDLDVVCGVPGQGTTNATLICAGLVSSPVGFASPFAYSLQPSTPESATWTRTLDGSLTQYLNLSVTCSANSASNSVTCKLLEVEARD